MKYFYAFRILLGLLLAGYGAISLSVGIDRGGWNYVTLGIGLALIILAVRDRRRSRI